MRPDLAICPIEGKISYPTHNEAERALHCQAKKPDRKRVGAAVYRCKCGAFHTTSHKVDKRRNERKLLAQRGVHV